MWYVFGKNCLEVFLLKFSLDLKKIRKNLPIVKFIHPYCFSTLSLITDKLTFTWKKFSNPLIDCQ